MPASITPFVFGEHMVRVHVDAQGELWFVAKDVCRVLDLSNVTEATRPLDEDERCSEFLNTSGGAQEMLLVSESGMYALVFRSRKPEARVFSKWVRAEVLPSLRRRGSYTLHGEDEAPAYTLQPAMPVDMLSQLPADVLYLPARTRDRAMKYALQMARVIGGAGQEYMFSLFVQCCRVIGTGRRGIAPTVDNDAVALDMVRAFVDEKCIRASNARLRCMQLYSVFVSWCEKRHNLGDVDIPSVIRFSRALEHIPDVLKVQKNPYSVFAGLRLT